MIKKLTLLFLLLFSYNNVSALQLCSPSEEYLDYMKLKEEERINYQEPIYCSSVFDKKISSSSSVIGSLNKAILGDSSNVSSSFYNAFDDGIVNRSENQFRTGLCWNFSALSVRMRHSLIHMCKNKLGR